MATKKIAGIALFVVGLGLAYWGYEQSGSVGSQFNRAVTGSHSDKVMALYISGAVGIAVGLFLLLRK